MSGNKLLKVPWTFLSLLVYPEQIPNPLQTQVSEQAIKVVQPTKMSSSRRSKSTTNTRNSSKHSGVMPDDVVAIVNDPSGSGKSELVHERSTFREYVNASSNRVFTMNEKVGVSPYYTILLL